MATIKHYKVVAALPSTLVADSIYLVRVGTGFDLYVTNSSGTIVAYPANYQQGSANLSALSGLTGAANKASYFTAAGAMAVYDLTVFGRSFAAAADAAAGRTVLGLGTAAVRNTGTSGANVPLLSTGNTWSVSQTINSGGAGYVGLQLVRADQGVVGETDTALIDIQTSTGATRLLQVSGPGGATQRWISIPRGGAAPLYHDGSGNREIWHSGNLVKQSSNVDVTSGSVMLAGAGGWLGPAPLLPSNDYNNGADYSGIVRNDNSAAAVNYPPQIASNAPMAALNVRFSTGYGWQLGVQTAGAAPNDANTRAFLRTEVNTAWSSWLELWHSGNLDNTESGWLTPTLVNSYTHGTDPVRYRRVGKFVVATCTLRRSSPPEALQTICTLPTGYRPTKQHTVAVLWISDNLALQATNVAIGTDGAIVTGLIYSLLGTPSGAGGASFTLIFPVG
jgi:hypothetical protein